MQLCVTTGASGFIGSELVRVLASTGLNGKAVSRSPIRDLPRGWEWHERGKILASDAGRSVLPGAVVLHLEAKHHVANPGPADLDRFQEVNVQGTEQWLDWAAARDIRRFVYFSSIKAVATDRPSDCRTVRLSNRRTVGPSDRQTESLDAPGSTPYGRSKWAAEQLVRQWAAEDRDRRALILRPAVVYGPGNTANVFAMVDALAKGRFFLIGANDNIK